MHTEWQKYDQTHFLLQTLASFTQSEKRYVWFLYIYIMGCFTINVDSGVCPTCNFCLHKTVLEKKNGVLKCYSQIQQTLFILHMIINSGMTFFKLNVNVMLCSCQVWKCAIKTVCSPVLKWGFIIFLIFEVFIQWMVYSCKHVSIPVQF